MSRWRLRAGVLAAVLVAFLMAVPASMALSPSPAASPQTPASAAVHAPVHGPPARVPVGPSMGVRPAVNCPLGYPMYSNVGSSLALTPKQSLQNPCPPIAQDEVHGTFFSNVSGSGENFTLPVYLPYTGGPGLADALGAFYVGMVMKGDTNSPWGESYAALSFQPSVGSGPSLNYSENVAIFSIINSSFFPTGGCPGFAMNFTWNGTYWCEVNEIHGGNGATLGGVPSGTWLNVTFVGTAGSTTGAASLWVNDSSGTYDRNWTFNHTVDNGVVGNVSGMPAIGNFSFEPAFRASCPLYCILNWSMPFGLGYGVDICPQASFALNCNSYNQLTWIALDPPEIGSPEFSLGGAYRGDYTYFAPESASGVCNTLLPPNQVASCIAYTQGGGTGYYPIFTLNGSHLNFGTNYSWTTEDFGGSNLQFLANGQPNLLFPFFLDQLSNDSLAGFIGPTSSLNVTVRLQDLGTIRAANLTYSIGGGTPVLIPMTLKSGTTSNGIYGATIPAGSSGLIVFQVNATNDAGVVRLSAHSSVQRGPIPNFTISIVTYPTTCGWIYISGTKYANGATPSMLPGFYPVVAQPCYPYIFGGWSLSPGLTISPSAGLSGTLEVTASGAVNASFIYVRPTDTIQITTNPSTCGVIQLNGQTYSNGATVLLLDSLTYSLSVVAACSLDASFAGWNFTGNFAILGQNFTPMGNGTLNANFVPSGSAYTLTFLTSPTDCGGVVFQGAGYTNTETIAVLAGTYSLGSQACAHFGFRNFSASTGITFTPTTVTVSSAGWVRETNYHLTEVTIATNPSHCGTITFDGTVYHNGQVVVVANNTTHTAVATPCAGYSLLGLNTTGGLTVSGTVLIANGSGVLTAVFQAGAVSAFVGFLTDPVSCGTIYMNGLTYHNSNFTQVPPGSVYPISATSCANYGFVAWRVTSSQNGGIIILGNRVFINSSGSITAIFRPLVTVILYTQPAGCGTILLNDVNYTNNQQATVASDASYGLAALPCPHYRLSNWLNSSTALINGGLVQFLSSSVLTAVFVPSLYPVTVVIHPVTCGTLRINGVVASNGTLLGLSYGTYGIQATPCVGDHLVGYSADGLLGLAGSTLYVNGSGNLSAVFQPVPPSVTLTVPLSTFEGAPVELTAAVAVPVPPFNNYTYTWTFGDGSASVMTPVAHTTHTYGSTGTFPVTVTVSDPYQRVAHAYGNISVLPSTSAASSVPWTTYAVVGGVLAAIIVAVAIGALLLRRRPPPPSEGAEPATPAATPELAEEFTPALPEAPKT